MAIDISNGINIEILGSAGKRGVIPVKLLINISKSLQDLIHTIATYDLTSSTHLNNFDIDFTGLKKCCAVAQYSYSPAHTQESIIEPIIQQRLSVSNKLDILLQVTDKREYGVIKELYPDGIRRNKIVESLSDFVNSPGNTPIRFVDFTEDNKIVPLFKMNSIKPEIKKSLMSDIIMDIEDEKHIRGYARIEMIEGKKKSQKVSKKYFDPEIALVYSPHVINFHENQYFLKKPPICTIEDDDENKSIIIKCDELDIYATGIDEYSAKLDFAEEFNYIFKRFNELPDEKLSLKNKKIKNYINSIVSKTSL